MMSTRHTFAALALAPLVCLAAAAQEPPPEGAMKYHAALLKSPDNSTLFDRFFNSWLDEQPVESLERFLTARSESHGSADLALLARFQIRRGLEDQALATLGKAIAARPDDPTMPMARAGILLRRLEFDAAREDLAKVAAGNDPTLALEAAKLTGKSFLREGRTEDALTTWDALLASNPGDEDLLEDLVESAAAEGQIDQALAYLDQLIEKSADPYRKTLRQLRRGELLARAGNSDDAALAYSNALANVGEGSWLEREIVAQFEKLFRSQDRVADLKDELRKMADDNPRRLLIHRQLAKLEAADGEIDSAIGRFREVLRRSPGETELREEFINLLIDSKRFTDAEVELEKMIAFAPGNAELHLRMAALSAEQEKPEATLASLEKARTLLGGDEAAGLRIASLMFGHALAKEGEALLEKLLAAENATPAPAEALAAEYARTNRKKEALALLEKTATSADMEIVIRIANSISRLGEREKSYAILNSRLADFPDDPRFLIAISQAALATSKPTESVAPAMKLLRLAKQEGEIRDAVALASRAIAAADENEKWLTALRGKEAPERSEICLLASLTETAGDHAEVKKLLSESTDPLLVRFHASLLERRGDFPAAIAALLKLAETEEGRKASFFKELSELQIRAGKTDEALDTLDSWKLSAPGDKTPWLIASNLLRNAGRTEEAITTTRSALARFGDDEDLAATLASLHEVVGSFPDAEEIYWRLYDSSPDPVSQSRWAAQLSTLAQRTSTTTELQEKFEQRARNNRRSLGPILAQIELARVMRDEVARHDLLQQALRLQPQKADLRIQLAEIEEQSGNPDAAIALIEDGLETDKSDRLRSALAQAHIRKGDVLKGTHMLRAISSNGTNDPRLIESLATTILTAGFPEEAVRFLNESLPDGGDWRTQYLLASILEDDGREDEAVPVLLSLQQAEGDLQGITPNPRQNHLYHRQNQTNRITSLFQAKSRIYQERRGYGWSGGVTLPSDPEQARLYSLVRLAKLVSDGDEKTEARIRDAGVKGIGFAKDLMASAHNQPDYLDLLEKHPDEPGLFELVVQSMGYGRTQGDTLRQKTIFRKLLKSDGLAPLSRLQAATVLLQPDNEDGDTWDLLLSAAEECAESDDTNVLTQTGQRILAILVNPATPVPPEHIDPLTGLLLEICGNDLGDPDPRNRLRLATFAILEKPLEWITEINAAVDSFRENQAKALKNQSRLRSYNPWQYGISEFTIPDIDRLWLGSLPINHLRHIQAGDQMTGTSMNITANTLLDHLDHIESPALKALVAIKAGKPEIAREILSAEPPQAEASDFLLLKTVLAISEKNFVHAYQLLDKSKPEHQYMAAIRDFSLIAIAQEMPPEQRQAVMESLRGILEEAAKQTTSRGAGSLAAVAKEFGFEDLEKRFISIAAPPATFQNRGLRKAANPGPASPLGPAVVFTPRPVPRASSPSRPQVSPLDRIRKFSTQGKSEAAAREILLFLRNSAKNGHLSERTIHESVKDCDDETRTALLALTAPGDSRSLTRILLHIDICLGMGETAEAVRELEKLVARRPHDTSLSIRLAFILPPEKSDQALALLTRSSTSDDFAMEAYKYSGQSLQSHETANALAHIERMTAWLETSSPEDLIDVNLSWISSQSLAFFNGRSRLPSLLQPLRENKNEPDLNQQCADLGERLAAAMMRIPALAEEGFRLNRASQAWENSPEELDEMARRVLLIAEVPDPEQQPPELFSIRLDSRNSSSAGDNLAEFSSMDWLVGRLETQEMAEVFPPEYLADLVENNPRVGSLVKAFTSMSDVTSLAEAWESEAMSMRDPISAMISDAILERAIGIPGASNYFLKKIKALESGSITHINNSNHKSEEIRLMRTAFRIAAQRGGAELDQVCEAIASALVEGTPGWETQEQLQKLYAISNTFNLLLADQQVPLRSVVRTLRILERLDLPFTNGEQWLNLNFRKLQVTDAKQGIDILESLGMLENAPDWKPLVTLMPNSRREGNETIIVRETRPITAGPGNLRLSISREDFVAALENHRPQTFGSLIAAASFTSGVKQEDLTTAAFALAKPDFVKMPDERLEDFDRFIPWLPLEAHAALPEYFQNQVKKENEQRLAALLEQAESYRTNSARPGRFLSNIRNIIPQIALLDPDQAVKIFLEAEASFTDDLSSGGALSSSSSPDAMLTDRDYCLEQILSATGSLKGGGPELTLRFLNAVLTSPAGGRFSLAAREANHSPLLRTAGEQLYRDAKRRDNLKPSAWLALANSALELPADLHDTALAAIACAAMEWCRLDDLTNEKTIAASSGKIEKYRAFVAEAVSSKSTDPEKPASKAIPKLLTDKTLSQTTRIQLAFSFATRFPKTPADPATAAAVADLFSAYCEADRSAVNQLSISLVTAASRTEISADNLPGLKHIHSAFWKNADAPKPGGHPAISLPAAKSLFLTALALEEREISGRLFKTISPSLKGDFEMIIKLVSVGRFDLAAEILPTEDNLNFRQRVSGTYTAELDAQLAAFRQSGVDQTALLRFEATLLTMRVPFGGHAVAERAARLAATYRKHPPADLRGKVTLLHLLGTTTDPDFSILSDELAEMADSFDALAVINELRDPQPRDRHLTLAKWDILCKAAALRFVAGEAQHAATLSAALETSATTASANHNDVPRTIHRRFLAYMLPSTCRAISAETTEAFDGLVEPLGTLAVALSKLPNYDRRQILATLALCELLAYWVDQPALFTAVLPKLETENDKENYATHFTFPRQSSEFFVAVRSYLVPGDREATFGPAPVVFLESYLSRPSVGDLLPCDSPWLGSLYSSGPHNFVRDFTDGDLPENLSPAGRALLLFNQALATRHRSPEESSAAWRASLAEIPQRKSWANLHARAACELAHRLLEKPEGIPEARKLLASVDMENAPQTTKTFYESLLNRLKTKERPPR